MAPQLDIVIPVYNEGAQYPRHAARARARGEDAARVLIVYDLPDDDTLPAIRDHPRRATRACRSNSCAITAAARTAR